MTVHRTSQYDSVDELLDNEDPDEYTIYFDHDHVIAESEAGDVLFYGIGSEEVRNAAVRFGKRLDLDARRQ